MRLIAKMPTLAALAYRTSKGLPIVYPRNDLVRALRLSQGAPRCGHA